MKHFGKLLMIVLVVLIFGVNVSAKDNSLTKFDKNQIKSIEKYNRMLDKFDSKYGELPDYYSGAYIDENGKLKIKITKDEKSLFKSDMDDLLIIKSDVINGTVPFKSLVKSQKELSKLINELENSNVEITGIYKDTILELLFVEVKGLDDWKIEAIQGYVNIENIEFINSEDLQVPTAATLNPINSGDNVVNFQRPTVASSVGFPATRNGQEGYVLSGHAVSGGHRIGFEDSLGMYQEVGMVTSSLIVDGVDASFVDLYPGYNVTTTTNDGKTIKYTTSGSYPQGTHFKLFGTTTYLSTLTLYDWSATTTVTYSFGNFQHNDMMRFTNLVLGGNSGGGIFLVHSSQYYTLVGNMVSSSQNLPISHGGKYSNMVTELGVTAILG